MAGQCSTLDHIYPCEYGTSLQGVRCYCGEKVWGVVQDPKQQVPLIPRPSLLKNKVPEGEV